MVNASVHFRFCFLARRWIGRDSGDGSVYDGLHPTFINRVSSNVRPMGGIVPEMTYCIQIEQSGAVSENGFLAET